MPRVTEKKRVKINTDCVDQPVYLNWMGLSGGRNYWLFGKRQNYGVGTAIVGEFQPYTEDIETAQGVAFDTGRTALPKLIIGAAVDREDAEGIKGVLYSPNVLRLMNPATWQTEGPVWQVVRPVPGSFKLWDTDQTRCEIEFTIELTELNIQST